MTNFKVGDLAKCLFNTKVYLVSVVETWSGPRGKICKVELMHDKLKTDSITVPMDWLVPIDAS